MNPNDTGRILAEELGRVLKEFKRVGDHAEQLVAERNRLADVAHRLLFILRELTDEKLAELIDGLGLADLIAMLPGVPGLEPSPAVAEDKPQRMVEVPSPDSPSTSSPIPATASVVPEVLAKGATVRMLAGKYQGWTGRVQQIHLNGNVPTYSVALTGPDGHTVPNQVSQRSLGKKWETTVAEVESRRAPSRRRVGKSTPPAAAKAVSTGTPIVLPKGTQVRLLAGIYEGATGEIGYTATKGSTVTYTVSLPWKGGKRVRTQVTLGSQGKTWRVLGEPVAVTTSESTRTEPPKSTANPAPAPERLPRRRRGTNAKLEVPSTRSKTATLPSTVVPRGTRVRVLKGMYQGRIGIIGYTQARGKSVVYTVNIDGHRTQVNQGTLGSTWEIEADAAQPADEGETPVVPVAPEPIIQVESFSPMPVPLSETVAPAAPPAVPSLPRGVLPKGTSVRMLTGHYLGYSGVVTGVHPVPGPKPDAIYTLELTGPHGGKTRMSVKQSSLGRAWVKAN